MRSWQRIRRVAGLLGVALALATTGWAVAAPAVSDTMKGLSTHRGVYELKLASHKDGSDVSSVEGKLVYEFTGSVCDGFSTQFRFVTKMEADGGKSRLTDMRTSSYEDGTGTSFNFLNQTYIASILTEDSKGAAERKDDGIGIDIARPKPGKARIEPDVLFPTQHLAHLIDAAKAGEHVVEIKLYDGTEGGEHVYLTTSVIGKELALDESLADEKAADVPELAKVRRWPVNISYYTQPKPGAVGESTPDYQLAFVLYENGVSRHMKLDYGDFVLEGRMVDFKSLEQKVCK